MAEFSRLIITKKGQALLAKAMLGECGVEFTKVSISSSEYGEEELEGLAELSGVRQTAPVSNVSRISGTEVSVAAEADNAGLAEGYYVRAVGLHAADPAGGEALCAVAVETSGNCHMPAYKGKTVSGIYIKLNMAVGNPENVSLEVSPAAVATIGDIKELRRELAAHAEFAGRYIGGDSGGRPAFAEGIQADDLVGAVNEVFDAIPAVTRSAAVTQEGKALDAVEKNAAVEGTLANQIGQINSNMAGKAGLSGRNIFSSQQIICHDTGINGGSTFNNAPLAINTTGSPNARAGIAFQNQGIVAGYLYLDNDGLLKFINHNGAIRTIG